MAMCTINPVPGFEPAPVGLLIMMVVQSNDVPRVCFVSFGSWIIVHGLRLFISFDLILSLR